MTDPRGGDLAYRIDSTDGLLEIRGTRSSDASTLALTLAAVLADPSYQRGYNVLCDQRDSRAPSPALVEAIVRLLDEQEEFAGSRWAVVVADPANYGTARLAAVKATTADVQVFDDVDEAQRWLRKR